MVPFLRSSNTQQRVIHDFDQDQNRETDALRYLFVGRVVTICIHFYSPSPYLNTYIAQNSICAGRKIAYRKCVWPNSVCHFHCRTAAVAVFYFSFRGGGGITGHIFHFVRRDCSFLFKKSYR